jgi:predicted Zn finger-like uncharacterized protein
MSAYHRVKFTCPSCGARLVVDAGQVRRREVVTCAACNTDIALIPAGGAARQPASDRRGAVPVQLEA